MERKIGRGGGITVPSSMRRDAGIEGGEKVDLKILANGDIMVKRICGTCVFCGNTDHVRAYKGRFVCMECRDGLTGGEQ